jgi:hypothetical protein
MWASSLEPGELGARDERPKLAVATNDARRAQRSNPVIAPDPLTQPIED